MRRGFTLLEMLLAVSILAVVLAAVYAMLHAGILAERTIKRADGQGRVLALAADQVVRTIEAAKPPRGILAGEFLGQDNPNGEGDSLLCHAAIDPKSDYSASSGTPSGTWDDIVRVNFYVSTDSEGRHNLVRTCVRNLLSPREQTVAEDVICRNIASFDLHYFDGTDWLDDWDSTQRGNTLPQAVEVNLTLAAPDENAGAQQSSQQPAEDTGLSLRRVVLLSCATGQEGT